MNLEPAQKCSKWKIALVTIAGVIVIFLGIHVTGLVLGYSPQWYQNYAPEQPIPFSHKRHAGQFKIPCLYCHSSAEYAAHSEIPGVDVCMNCHKAVLPDSPWIKQIKEAYDTGVPIAWIKVHVMPDFVRFNHKRHIAAGVQCAECHGPVEEMERVYQWAGLNMGWCINCHRDDNHLTDYRIEISKKEQELKGNPQPMFWEKPLMHKNPHNADTSCSACHY